MAILVGIILIIVVGVGAYVGINNHKNEAKNKPSDWICNIDEITYIAGLPNVVSGSMCRIEVFVEKLLIEYDGSMQLVYINDISAYKIVSASYIKEKVKVGKFKVKGELILVSRNKRVKFNNFLEMNYKIHNEEFKTIINMGSNDELVRITSQIDQVQENCK
ncbi:MAG: hypothetical protein RR515_00285 [Clostridium sp.]